MISSEPIIQVLMIIVSCLLAWGEAWFLDCRVIPQEKYAHLVYNAVVVCLKYYLTKNDCYLT